MREEKASSSDGSELDRRVFVSMRESSCTMLRGGDADLRDLALDKGAKKFLMWDCALSIALCHASGIWIRYRFEQNFILLRIFDIDRKLLFFCDIH